MIDHYDWPGGREAMLRFGPDTGPVVIGLLPLLEEANRTRTFLVTMLRRLADRGIGSVLPDLPGTGESMAPTSSLSLASMGDAVRALAVALRDQGRMPHSAAIRSGALLDVHADVRRWHFAPHGARELRHELQRQKLLGKIWSGEGEWFDALAEGPGRTVEVAGNVLPAAFFAELGAYPALFLRSPGDRVVRLDTDAAGAERKVAGAPLWRRAEPDNDPILAALLADDIAAWVRQCEG